MLVVYGMLVWLSNFVMVSALFVVVTYIKYSFF